MVNNASGDSKAPSSPESPNWAKSSRIVAGYFLVGPKLAKKLESIHRIIDIPSVFDVPRTDNTIRWFKEEFTRVFKDAPEDFVKGMELAELFPMAFQSTDYPAKDTITEGVIFNLQPEPDQNVWKDVYGNEIPTEAMEEPDVIIAFCNDEGKLEEPVLLEAGTEYTYHFDKQGRCTHISSREDTMKKAKERTAKSQAKRLLDAASGRGADISRAIDNVIAFGNPNPIMPFGRDEEGNVIPLHPMRDTVTEQRLAGKAPKERPSFDETFMEIANVVSKRSTCPRLAVGAVLTVDKQIIATGYNGSPTGLPHCTEVGCLMADCPRCGGSGGGSDPFNRCGYCDGTGYAGGCKRTTHAEANAILQVAKHGGSTDGAKLYVTHSPCIDCAKLIITSGIKEVIYGRTYGRDGMADNVQEMFDRAGVYVSEAYKSWNQ